MKLEQTNTPELNMDQLMENYYQKLIKKFDTPEELEAFFLEIQGIDVDDTETSIPNTIHSKLKIIIDDIYGKNNSFLKELCLHLSTHHNIHKKK